MMELERKIAWNQRQAEKYGWTPDWFGADGYNELLIERIVKWQKMNGLEPDGLCGNSTFRKIWTERESIIDSSTNQRFIIHNNNKFPIKWDIVVLWNDDGGMKSSHYRNMAGKPPRKPRLFVNHHDVCLSSKSCHSVLQKRNLSVHFLIDGDPSATIYQCLDTQHTAYHCGKWNSISVGVEINTPWNLKYQDWHLRKGRGKRPVWGNVECHGRTLEPHLGFYPRQIKALAALWEAVSRSCDIPLETLTNKGINEKAISGDWKGFIGHLHVSANKIDPAGLDFEQVKKQAIELSKL